MRRRSYASGGGTLYAPQSRANFQFRRHIRHDRFTVAATTCKIYPFLAYTNAETLTATANTTYDGGTVDTYGSPYCIEGSRVRSQHLDILIKPNTASDADVIAFYTARIMTSFHDIKSGDIRGLGITENDKPQWATDPPSKTLSDFTDDGATFGAPALAFNKHYFNVSYKLQHWWRGVRKSVMAAGQPLNYTRREWIPRKCTRINEGTCYAMVIMNDDDSNTLEVEIKQTFDEVPLVQ